MRGGRSGTRWESSEPSVTQIVATVRTMRRRTAPGPDTRPVRPRTGRAATRPVPCFGPSYRLPVRRCTTLFVVRPRTAPTGGDTDCPTARRATVYGDLTARG